MGRTHSGSRALGDPLDIFCTWEDEGLRRERREETNGNDEEKEESVRAWQQRQILFFKLMARKTRDAWNHMNSSRLYGEKR